MAHAQTPDVHAPHVEGDAQSLAARIPALLVEARRVAMTVAQGVHGRRRAGPGETFWQFRNFEAGDSSLLIDWRRSANASHHLYVREREWEAAHTVWLWPDISPSMMFRSHLATHSKAERAVVLTLAMSALLTQAGERTALAGVMPPTASRQAIQKLAATLTRSADHFSGLPGAVRLPRHSELVICSDFLDDPSAVNETLGNIAMQGVRGHLIHLLDPAEESLPYSGRVRFLEMEGGGAYMAERAETLKAAYGERLQAHKHAIAQHARRLGWSYFVHHTDRPAAEILLAVHTYLSGLDKGYKAMGVTMTRTGRSQGGGTLPQ